MKKNSLDILKNQGHGFNVPKGYFDTIENDVFAKISTEKFPKKEGFAVAKDYFETFDNKVLKAIASEKLKKTNFEIPKDYFETLEDKVFEKLQKEKVAEPKVIKLRTRILKVVAPIAVAASLLLFFVFQYNTSDQNKMSIDSIASTEIENWINDDLISLDSYEIAEAYSDVSFVNDETILESIELEDYLNGMDVESILLND